MRLKAILADIARKRYPLSILIIVVGVLVIPFPFLFICYGLELAGAWWAILGIVTGIVTGSIVIGLGSLVEDIHDISMHTMGYDLEFGEIDVDDVEPEAEDEPEDAHENEDTGKAGEPVEADAESDAPSEPVEQP